MNENGYKFGKIVAFSHGLGECIWAANLSLFFSPPAMHCVDSTAQGDVGIRDQGSKVSVTSRLSI